MYLGDNLHRVWNRVKFSPKSSACNWLRHRVGLSVAKQVAPKRKAKLTPCPT